MIIRGLEAENLLKYRLLRLDELPEQGVIGISGNNESGKSAIGEILCFALFGRTYSLALEDVSKLLRWGAIRGRAALRFVAKDQEFEIVRHLERSGEQAARLTLREQAQEPLVRGVEAVNEHMEQMLGYGFEEYTDTFYLAQREITAPHPHSPTIKNMAGILPLERCVAELCGQIEQDEATAALLERQITEAERQLELLCPERLCIEDIQQELAEERGQEQRLVARIGSLTAAVDAYCRACSGLRSHPWRRGLADALQVALVLSLLAAVGLWALLLVEPQRWVSPAFRDSMEDRVGLLGLPLEAALAYGILVLVVGLLLTWSWAFALNLIMRKRRSRARQLGEELRLVDELRYTEDRIARWGAAGDGPQEPTHRKRGDPASRTRLAAGVLALQAGADEVRAAAAQDIAWMERGREALAERREELARTLTSARKDRERERQLEDEREKHVRELAAQRKRIAQWGLACELLTGALREKTDRFNEHLRDLVSRNLPRFTDGRYEYLEVADDLRVHVYSNEKRGFLDLEEISAGTQRQIMLALRLALAQERMLRIGKDRQFAFLDEPFAFFDDTRMRGALRLLPQVSDVITQHWVVAQRFPRDEFLALEIPCGRDPDTLEIGMAQPSRHQA